MIFVNWLSQYPLWTLGFPTVLVTRIILCFILFLIISILFFNDRDLDDAKASEAGSNKLHHSLGIILMVAVLISMFGGNIITNYFNSKSAELVTSTLNKSNYSFEIENMLMSKKIIVLKNNICPKKSKKTISLGEGYYKDVEKMWDDVCPVRLAAVECNEEFSLQDCIRKIDTEFNSIVDSEIKAGS